MGGKLIGDILYDEDRKLYEKTKLINELLFDFGIYTSFLTREIDRLVKHPAKFGFDRTRKQITTPKRNAAKRGSRRFANQNPRLTPTRGSRN